MATKDGEDTSVNCSSGTKGNVIVEIILSAQEILHFKTWLNLNINDIFFSPYYRFFSIGRLLPISMLASEGRQSKYNVFIRGTRSHRKVITKSQYINDNKQRQYKSLHDHNCLIYRSINKIERRMASSKVGRDTAHNSFSGKYVYIFLNVCNAVYVKVNIHIREYQNN